MSSTISLGELTLGVKNIVDPFLERYDLRPIETDLDDEVENTPEPFYLRAILLLKRILAEEMPTKYERFFKELLLIATLEEIRISYVDYYRTARSKSTRV